MYSIDNMPNQIDIGFTGEKAFRKVEIDMTKWMVKMPGGYPSIVHIRPGEKQSDAYIAVTTFANNILTWTISDADLGPKEGIGSAQIWLEETQNSSVSKRGKSIKVATQVHGSINDASATPPTGQEAFLEQVNTLKNAAVSAAESALAYKTDALAAKDDAESAASDALSAKNDAVDAKTDAESAQGNAEAAQSAAEAAQALAEAAQSAAEGAQEAAETAQGLAESAQAAAEDAQEAAEAAQEGAEAAILHAPIIEDDVWMVWDPDEEDYVSTGVTAEGVDGDDGTNAYVHIKYAAAQPTQDSDMKDTADAWMGIYSGDSSTAPTTYTSYTWYNIKGESGGDPTSIIDDTAGSGTTNKVWSANKTSGEVSSLLSALTQKQDAPASAGTSGQVLGLDSNLQPEWKTVSGGGTVDSELSKTSTNPVQNKVITNAIDGIIPVTTKLSQWLYAEDKYIDSNFELHNLEGYDTYRIPCEHLDFFSLTWIGSNPFGDLSQNYYYALEDNNGLRRDLGDTNRVIFISDKRCMFIAPSDSVAIYFTFKVSLLENLTFVKNTPRKYAPENDYADGFIIPVNQQTFAKVNWYFNAVSYVITTWTSNDYNVYWCKVNKGDTIKLNANVSGLNYNASYRDTSDVVNKITGLTHTFATDAIVVLFEKTDQTGNAFYIKSGAKLMVSAENVVGFTDAVEDVIEPFTTEVEEIDERVESIENEFDNHSAQYNEGDVEGYYRLVSGSSDEVELKASSSFTCKSIVVQEWMYKVSFKVLSVSGISSTTIFCGFTSDTGKLISRNPVSVGEYELEVPSNAKNIIISFYGATFSTGYTILSNPVIRQSNLDALSLENKYDGLTGVAFGTSLTYRAQTTGGFLQYLPGMSGITFDNQGIGSSTILGDGGNLDMLARIKSYDSYSGKDVCLLEGFVNDWYGNKTLGTWKDTAETTVCGCVRSALNYMLSQNANMTLFLILDPYGRNYNSVDCSSTAVNSASLTQKEFYDEIAKVGESLGIPVIKEYAESQISENTPQYMIDNIHPSATGAKQSANFIWSKMKQYYPNET